MCVCFCLAESFKLSMKVESQKIQESKLNSHQMSTGGTSQRTYFQLYYLSANHTFPSKLVHQHRLSSHQRPTVSLFPGNCSRLVMEGNMGEHDVGQYQGWEVTMHVVITNYLSKVSVRCKKRKDSKTVLSGINIVRKYFFSVFFLAVNTIIAILDICSYNISRNQYFVSSLAKHLDIDLICKFYCNRVACSKFANSLMMV